MEERRRSIRVETDFLFKIGSGAGAVLEARGVNLSKTGALCVIECDIRMMTQLEMTLILPRKEIHLKGVLVRKEKEPFSDRYRIAIYFSEVTPADKKALEKFIESRQKSSARCLAVFLLLPILFFGCAGIEPPSPREILENPLGKGPLRIGMTREEVRSLWGNPDQVNKQNSDSLGSFKEEWVYEARYPGALPADVGYVSKSKYLVFDGENLVSFRD